jgi:hypothetical protein
MTRLRGWKCFSVAMTMALILGVGAIVVPSGSAQAQAGTWDIQVVDDMEVMSTSLALDSHGYPHISYTTGFASGSLHYARWTGTGWVTETVDDVPAIVTSLALSSRDRPHICYTTPEDSLHYAHWTGADWAKETVDTEVVTDCSLALDSHGRPHVCYITPGVAGHELQYAWLTDTGWDHSLSTFDPDSGYPNSCSLALDSHDQPHIGFATSGGPFTVHYYHLAGGVWDDEVVDDGSAGAVSIALDSYDRPHISYATAEATFCLHYAWLTDTGWAKQTVDPADVWDCSLALDSNNLPHISYFVGSGFFDGFDDHEGDHTMTGMLKYANLTASGWNIQTLDQETVTWEGLDGHAPIGIIGGGKWSSIALDSEDLPHISYGNLVFSIATTSLHYAHFVPPPVVLPPPAGPGVSPAPPHPLNPYNMSLQYLNINPGQASVGQPITITTNVVNTGDEAGNMSVALKIDGQLEQSRMVSVGAHSTQPVQFTVTKDHPGTYNVDILDKTGSFTILGAGGSGGTTGSKTGGLIVLALIGVLIVATVVVLLARRS